MDKVQISYTGGVGFQVEARGHQFAIDLAQDKGGQDLGMNPPEVFMASLGACVGVYVARYCQTAKLDAEGMKIELDWQLSDDKTRITSIDISFMLPKADIGRRRQAILDVAHRCLLHNTILNAPEIRIALT